MVCACSGSSLTREDVRPKIRELVNQLFRDIPSGAGQSGNIRISYPELDKLLQDGAAWMAEHGYGRGEDLTHCEENGAIDGADPGMVSDHAKKRGLPQVGTLGLRQSLSRSPVRGAVFDPGRAEALGLYENEVVVLIHSGSRGLGHQVCTDYLREMGPAMHRYGIDLPDRQLACVPVKSPEGQAYLGRHARGGEFCLGQSPGDYALHPPGVQADFRRAGGTARHLRVCHNIAKLERHQVDGREREVMVHRKGATRAFPPAIRDVPEVYQQVGQPVLIPGSMGTSSYVLVGARAPCRRALAPPATARAA